MLWYVWYMTQTVFDLLMTMPPRSECHPLAPLGVGTPWAESLTSYLSRLAFLHRVPVATLASQGRYGTVIPHQARGLNGVTALTAEWVHIIERMTMRTGLDALTLLPISGPISPLGLFHAVERWCPACLQEWADRNEEPYLPLLWSLNLVSACPIHHAPLQDHCPHCSRNFRSLKGTARPGFCSLCGGWLGNLDDSSIDVLPLRHEWVVAKLIEHTSMGASDSHPQFADNFLNLVQLYGESHIVNVTGLSTTFVRFHHYGIRSKCKLENVVKLAVGLQIPINALMFEDMTVPATKRAYGSSDSGVSGPRSRVVKRLALRRNPVVAERHVQDLVTDYIAAHDFRKKLTMGEIAQHVGCSVSYLKKHFPKLGRELADRHVGCFRDRLIQACGESAEVPLSLYAATQRCQIDVHSALMVVPDLCAEISSRHEHYQRGVRDAKIASVRTAFLHLLRETISSPITQNQVAERLGVSVKWLRTHLPDLMAVCAKQATFYRHTRVLIREVTQAEQILRAMAVLLREGCQPTAHLLHSRFNFYFRDPQMLQLVAAYHRGEWSGPLARLVSGILPGHDSDSGLT